MNLQKLVIRSLMKLPEGLLPRMAGGEPLSIDGRAIDPRRDRGTEYADRLAHAFTAMSGILPAAKQACEDIAADAKAALHASA